MDSRKPLTAGERQEIGVLLYRAGFETTNGGTVDETDVADMHRTCRRLLSLLTPPPDAAVREAVAEAEIAIIHEEHLHNMGECCTIRSSHLRTILRAVQAPRLTPEQGERLRGAADTLEAHGEVLEAQWLRAAFPEAFAVEVGRG